jgi:hypothetical protein
MTLYTVHCRTLSENQSAEVNRSGWRGVIWGTAFMDVGFIRVDADKQLPPWLNANLFILHSFEIYRRGYDIEIDQPDLSTDHILEVIFEAGNISPDHTMVSSFKKYDRIPSISVGDLVFCDEYDRGWICCNTGWAELPKVICEFWHNRSIRVHQIIARINHQKLAEVSS